MSEEEKNKPSLTQQLENPQIVFSWKAPVRAYKKKSTGVLRFYIALALLITLIVMLLGDIILVLPIWASVFIFYVLTVTPPDIIENRITVFGVSTDKNNLRWENLSHFYYYKKFDYYILTIVSLPPYQKHTYFVVNNKHDLSIIVNILSEHIVFSDKPENTLTDRIAIWLTKLMPNDEIPTKEEHQDESLASVQESLERQMSSPSEEHPRPSSPHNR